MEELSHLLEVNQNGLVTYEGNAAYGEQVRFWLDSPQGSIWGNPSWGNPFADFKFIDPTDDSCIEMELKTLSAFKRDLPNVPLSNVVITLANETDKETFLIAILLPNETIKTSINGVANNAA